MVWRAAAVIGVLGFGVRKFDRYMVNKIDMYATEHAAETRHDRLPVEEDQPST